MPEDSRTRYRFIVENRNPNQEPSKAIKEVATRLEARDSCQIGGDCIVLIVKEKLRKQFLPGIGWVSSWKPVASGCPSPEELHSDIPLDDFVHPV